MKRGRFVPGGLEAAMPVWALLLASVPLAASWFAREYTHNDLCLAYLGWIRSA